MKVCKETEILNFLLACFKKISDDIRCVHEFNMDLNGNEVKPDLFCYFPLETNFYNLFEIKKRNTTSEAEINETITPQYQGYKHLDPTDLKGYLVPRDTSAEIYINYIFYRSDINIVKKIVDDVPLIDCWIYLLSSNKQFKEVQTIPGTPNTDLWEDIKTFSNDESQWEKIYVPFTVAKNLDICGYAQISS